MGSTQSIEDSISTESKDNTDIREFYATPALGLSCTTDDVGLKLSLETEAIAVYGNPSGTKIRSFPYHIIVCWGYTEDSFQWRYRDEDTMIQPVIVGTTKGRQIEDALLSSVKTLMEAINSVTLSTEDFCSIKDLLQEDTAMGIRAVQQVALSRKFHVQQACEIIRIIGDVSPFDKVEAAVTLHDRLLAPDSFELLLEEFDDVGDRDNIRHRAGRAQKLKSRIGIKKPT